MTMPSKQATVDEFADVARPARREAAPGPPTAEVPLDPQAAAVQISTLRSINARLLREIETLKEREAHALRLADRDGLTGLYNRRRMSELLDAAIGAALRGPHRLALLFIDLDGFKRINDRFGHTVGDELLMAVAGRIATRARSGDVVCRYGGDEFVVVLPHVPSRGAALEVASTLAKRVALPYRLSGEELWVTAAIGVAVCPDDGRTAAHLLSRADQLMYRAKAMAADTVREAELPPPSRRRDDKSRRRPA